MGITKEDVWAAADQLEAKGSAATLVAVRKQLGTGSFSTIQPFMAEWRDRQAKAVAVHPDMPDDLQGQLRQFGAMQWLAASELAQRHVELEREALRAARQQLDAEREEMGEWADRGAEELAASHARIATFESVVADLREALEIARKEHAVLQSAVAAAERRVDEERRERREAVDALVGAREAIGRLEGQMQALQVEVAEPPR